VVNIEPCFAGQLWYSTSSSHSSNMVMIIIGSILFEKKNSTCKDDFFPQVNMRYLQEF
jgi:hypothetical protein